MSNKKMFAIGLIITILGGIVCFASFFVGMSSFSNNFDDFAGPFIVLGIGIGIIICALGQIICCLSNYKRND